ncbi:MAG: 2-phosphoglycerate kinase [Oscillospiraceae bacterium]
MVILIGGVSCTGKTLMAQTLLEKHHIPYLSIDHLKMGLVRGTVNCGFTPTDSDDHIAGVLWPIIKGIVMTAIENEQDLIIEGCYIPPEELNSFPSKYAREIIALYIGFSRDYVRASYESGILAHGSAIELREKAERPMEWFEAAHRNMRERCQRCGVHYFEIDGDYEEGMKRVYRWLDGRIKALEEQ